jgi:hypothetical protein
MSSEIEATETPKVKLSAKSAPRQIAICQVQSRNRLKTISFAVLDPERCDQADQGALTSAPALQTLDLTFRPWWRTRMPCMSTRCLSFLILAAVSLTTTARAAEKIDFSAPSAKPSIPIEARKLPQSSSSGLNSTPGPDLGCRQGQGQGQEKGLDFQQGGRFLAHHGRGFQIKRLQRRWQGSQVRR